MVETEDERIYRELGALLDGRPVHDVAPVLVVAAARALATEADGDADKLVFLVRKFSNLLAEQALDMLGKDNDGRHINPH
jgi:hypothetical protein